MPERVFLSIVRGSIEEDHPLAEPEAERLVMAMAEERRSFVEQQMTQGLPVRVESGLIVQQVDAGPPARIHWDLIARYNQRLDRILARHLNAARIAAFQRQRKERLDNARYVQQLLR